MSHDKENSRHMAEELTETINGRLIISLRDISHTMRALYEGKGSQKRVLIILREAGTMTQRELTERLGIQSGSASEVIAKLEGAGLIARTLSESDRRTADISLTEEGWRKADEALEQRKRRHEEMFSVLSTEEKAALLALLDKINRDWEERYRGDRERRRDCRYDRRDLRRDHHRGRHYDREERCDHNCGSCPHPCGRGGKA